MSLLYRKRILPQYDIQPVIITGRISSIVQERARELNINELYQGIPNKLEQLILIEKKFGVSKNEIAYIGDDVNDLECIYYCGITGCPNDAVTKVKESVNYICNRRGGKGAVREFIEWILE